MIILKDIEALQQGKIDKTQIVNGLGETEIGKVLDATQGKVLGDKINTLNVDRGYLNTVLIREATSAKDLYENGVYASNLFTDAPKGYPGWFIIEVNNINPNYCYQRAIKAEGDYGKDTCYIRYKQNGVFSEWKQIATINDISNPNLLINGDFQVWQRGTSFNGNKIYTADRWFGHSIKCEKVDNGILVNEGGVLEYKMEELQKYIGIPLTLSYSIDGKVFTQTKTLSKNEIYLTEVVSFRSDSWTDSSRFTVNNLVAPYTINWVKIELGNKATQFTPRTYAEELAMCQRYYECGDVGGRRSFYYTNGRNAVEGVYFRQTKRIKPTVNIFSHPSGLNPLTKGKITDAYSGGLIGEDVFAYHNAITENGVAIITSITPLPTTDRDVYSYYFTADAEIY